MVAVPLSLVSAAWVLHLRGETLTTMTLLGLAAATAVVVDDVVGDVAALRSRQLAAGTDGPSLSSVMGDLVSARRGPLLVGLVMAVLVMAPVLAIGGVWNAFSWPLAATYVLAAVASLLVALIVTPALAVLLLRDGRQELRAGPLDRWIRSGADRLALPAIGEARFGRPRRRRTGAGGNLGRLAGPQWTCASDAAGSQCPGTGAGGARHITD